MLGTLELEITGTLSPIRILAFSLLRVRMRGLASRLASVSVSLKLAVADSPLAVSRLIVRWCRSPQVAALDGVPSVKLFGQSIPRSVSRSRDTSSTSTSSITSGSGRSCAAIIRSATRIDSGVARIETVLARSSVTISLIFSRLLSSASMCLASVLDNWNVRTLRSWYSCCLAAVAG